MTVPSSPDPVAVAPVFGPAAGEPPLWVDPRRWGSVIGLVGGMVFIASYSPALGSAVSAIVWVLGICPLVAALFFHYVRPVSLGPLARPRPLALAVYVGCVVGQVALIAAGVRALTAADLTDLQPALIAAVVGLHFVPFAWAFQERMFLYLGGAVAAVGVAGLVAGGFGISRAAEVSAVMAGLIMLATITQYARGRFAPSRREGRSI